tara:strand:+ start:8516 stop:8704 length:189 start_codon:yes stop_codon:yes gene_type:complete
MSNQTRVNHLEDLKQLIEDDGEPQEEYVINGIVFVLTEQEDNHVTYYLTEEDESGQDTLNDW